MISALELRSEMFIFTRCDWVGAQKVRTSEA